MPMLGDREAHDDASCSSLVLTSLCVVREACPRRRGRLPKNASSKGDVAVLRLSRVSCMRMRPGGLDTTDASFGAISIPDDQGRLLGTFRVSFTMICVPGRGTKPANNPGTLTGIVSEFIHVSETRPPSAQALQAAPRRPNRAPRARRWRCSRVQASTASPSRKTLGLTLSRLKTARLDVNHRWKCRGHAPGCGLRVLQFTICNAYAETISYERETIRASWSPTARDY